MSFCAYCDEPAKAEIKGWDLDRLGRLVCPKVECKERARRLRDEPLAEGDPE